MDLLDGFGYVAVLSIVFGLPLTGHIPRDLDLLDGAALGALLLLIAGAVVIQRRKRHGDI